jgi:23S rRNA (cytosine1962-C5)-methyltransferase
VTYQNPIIFLKNGREQSVLRRHPWVFSGAIGKLEGNPVDGQTVEIFDSQRHWLARGSYSSKSQISVRLLTFDEEEEIDEDFWGRRIRDSIPRRKSLDISTSNNSIRLIFAESDGMPGVIVDRYADYLVCQFSSAGAEFWKESIVRQLQEQWPCKGIFERSDSDSRTKEGFPVSIKTLAGETPPDRIQVREQDLVFNVDVFKGHKTGFYLDQSINRNKIMRYSTDSNVLNCFSYTGGFGISSAKAGAASVINVDTSEEALQQARDNFLLNNLEGKTEFICQDVFNVLRTYRDSRRQFDVIILDPPKFVASASQLEKGARGYKDINLLAFKLLRPGGILVTFSCSGYVKPELFQKIVADAASDAGRQAQILEHLFQAPDHPVLLSFPEGLYLKGLVCRAD